MTNSMLRDLVALLASDSVTRAEVIDRLGVEVGQATPATIRSRWPHLQAAELACYPNTLSPYALTLEFDPRYAPRVSELRTLFGESVRAPHDRGMSMSLVFERIAAGNGWTVTAIAELPPSARDTDDAPVTRIILRRDPIAPPA